VARQPIFEMGRGLYGYELLYRRDASIERADGEDGYMSAEVIVGSLLGIGLHSIAGPGLAFVNFSRGQLLNESWQLFEPATVIIELLENVERTAETIAACERMVAAGYRLALDDFVYDEASKPLVDLASIIKVDVLGCSPSDLETLAGQLHPYGVRLLAERVETATVRDVCVDLGFDLFQGYLFSRPETLTKTDVSAGQLAIMRLLNLLQDPRTTDNELDSAFQSDVALCYKLLRIVNAAALGGRGITSIPHAVRLVGRETLHRWLAIILVASLGRKGDVSHELALTAMTRARMCELLTMSGVAAAGNGRQGGSAFIVGLLSLLDVLLEVPMDKILAKLELADDVHGALLRRSGPLASQLHLVEAYEKANWDAARSLATETAVPDDMLPTIYLDALHWAAERISD
jgi:EAL and modified HD-GYP domain-containing signal transduction protein